jgi:nicotinamidase-related amidase
MKEAAILTVSLSLVGLGWSTQQNSLVSEHPLDPKRTALVLVDVRDEVADGCVGAHQWISLLAEDIGRVASIIRRRQGLVVHGIAGGCPTHIDRVPPNKRLDEYAACDRPDWVDKHPPPFVPTIYQGCAIASNAEPPVLENELTNPLSTDVYVDETTSADDFARLLRRRQPSVTQILVAGVATDQCIISRSWGVSALSSRFGPENVVLLSDLTDVNFRPGQDQQRLLAKRQALKFIEEKYGVKNAPSWDVLRRF